MTSPPSAFIPLIGTQPRFGVIVADPPWHYNQYRDAAHGAAKSAYQCLGLPELCKVPVWAWAAKTCVLALWCTNPKLEEGLALLRAWGFQYKTKTTWIKNSPKSCDLSTGVGIWFQGATEDILWGVRGEVGGFSARRGRLGFFHEERDEPRFWDRVKERSLIHPKSKKHSEKPTTLQDYCETFPGPYLELFATKNREGWTTWGLDTGHELGPWGERPYEAFPPPDPPMKHIPRTPRKRRRPKGEKECPDQTPGTPSSDSKQS